LASGVDEKPFADSIQIWNTSSSHTTKYFTGHTESVYSLVVLQDGRLAIGSGVGTVRLENLI
jgi:WD40 repeat protein